MSRAREDRQFERYRRSRNVRALAAVFDSTAPVLWRLAAKLCSDRHAAEDAVQSTFLRAIEDAESWDSNRPVLPWLLGILTNQVRQARRSRERWVDGERIAEEPLLDPSVAAEDGELRDALVRALESVPVAYRKTLEFHLLDGSPPHEIASALGIRAGTVRMHLHRGLRFLRKNLPEGLVATSLIGSMAASAQASMRRQVLSKAAEQTVLGTLAGPVSLVGLITMKKALAGLVIATVLILPLVGGLIWQRSGDLSLDEGRVTLSAELSGADRSPALTSHNEGQGEVAVRIEVEHGAPGRTKSLRILVVDAITGEPVRDAELWGAPDFDETKLTPSEREVLRPMGHDYERVFRRFGRSTRSGKDGYVELHLPEDLFTYQHNYIALWRRIWIARSGDRYGMANVRGVKDGLLQIKVKQDIQASVLVLDAKGDPADRVKVTCTTTFRDTGSLSIWSVTTDRNGIARLSHLQNHLTSGYKNLRVSIEIPGVQLPSVSVDRLALPREAIVFRLPPTGRIVVPTLSTDESPYLGPGKLTLSLLGEKHRRQKGYSIPVDTSPATFYHVGLGKQFELTLTSERQTLVALTVTGPSDDREVVEQTLSLDGLTMIRATLFDPQGRLYSMRPLAIDLVLDGEHVRKNVQADLMGRIAVVLRPENRARRLTQIDIASYSPMPRPSGGQSIRTIELDCALPKIVDLGELTLEDDPVIASGKVVDEHGDARGFGLIEVYSIRDGEPIKSYGVRNPVLGEFEIRGRYAGSQLRITAHSNDWRGEVTCSRGDTSVEIVRRRLGRLSAMVGASECQAEDLVMKLELEGSDRTFVGHHSRGNQGSSGLRYAWDGLPHGSYKLVGRLLADADPFCAIEGIVVGPSLNRDPRLDTLSVGTVVPLEISLVNTAGLPLGDHIGGVVFVRNRLQPTLWDGQRIAVSASFRKIMVRPGPHDVRVCLRGYEPVQMDKVEGTAIAFLVARQRLVVTLSTLGELEPGETLAIRLQPAKRGTDTFRFFFNSDSENWFDENGHMSWRAVRPGRGVVLFPPFPGTYQVEVSRVRMTEGGMTVAQRTRVPGVKPSMLTLSRELSVDRPHIEVDLRR